MLSTRASTILNLLVDEYVWAATPVPSKGIVRGPALKGSPETVRSAKSQVTEECYISRSLNIGWKSADGSRLPPLRLVPGTPTGVTREGSSERGPLAGGSVTGRCSVGPSLRRSAVADDGQPCKRHRTPVNISAPKGDAIGLSIVISGVAGHCRGENTAAQAPAAPRGHC